MIRLVVDVRYGGVGVSAGCGNEIEGRAYYGPPLVVPLLKAWGRGDARTKAPGLFLALYNWAGFSDCCNLAPVALGAGFSVPFQLAWMVLRRSGCSGERVLAFWPQKGQVSAGDFRRLERGMEISPALGRFKPANRMVTSRNWLPSHLILSTGRSLLESAPLPVFSLS